MCYCAVLLAFSNFAVKSVSVQRRAPHSLILSLIRASDVVGMFLTLSHLQNTKVQQNKKLFQQRRSTHGVQQEAVNKVLNMRFIMNHVGLHHWSQEWKINN